MRCPKCGKFNWRYPKRCKKCGAEFPVVFKKKHRRLLWIITIIFLCLLIGFIFLGISMDKQFNSAVAGIQDNLAKVAAAKKGGDFIMAGKKTGATMESIQTTAIASAKNIAELAVPDELKNYQAAAISWSIRIAAAAGSPNDWRLLKNQPDDFPLALTDAKVSNIFKPIIQNISELKESGVEAIQNNDREAMLRIGAKILVQNHWLNALLHSQKDNKTSFLASSALAALEVPPVGQGVDVTCSVCDYPDAYKVKWTEKLRQQYGCEVRCHHKPAAEEQTSTEEKTAADDAAKYADALSTYAYDDAHKRVICIGTGGTENKANGGTGSHKFCVEDAISSTNEIAASAIGFVEGTKKLTAEQWDNEYKNIDLALGLESETPSQPATTDGQVETPPSQPSASGGHKEGGIGTVQQGEPIVAPEPTQENKGGIWDGYYELSGTCVERCHGGLCETIDCSGEVCRSYIPPDKHTQTTSGLSVSNNQLSSYTGAPTIGANGYVKVDTSPELGMYFEFQFTKTGNTISVTEKSHSGGTAVFGGLEVICNLSGTKQY